MLVREVVPSTVISLAKEYDVFSRHQVFMHYVQHQMTDS